MSSTKTCKIILLGEAGVGKTCIINRYIKNKFTENQDTTIGAAFSSKEVVTRKGVTNASIWDTAGSEIFRSINKLFYRDAAIAILVYDISKKDTFEEIKNYWFDELRKEAGKRISKFNNNNLY